MARKRTSVAKLNNDHFHSFPRATLGVRRFSLCMKTLAATILTRFSFFLLNDTRDKAAVKFSDKRRESRGGFDHFSPISREREGVSVEISPF